MTVLDLRWGVRLQALADPAALDCTDLRVPLERVFLFMAGRLQ